MRRRLTNPCTRTWKFYIAYADAKGFASKWLLVPPGKSILLDVEKVYIMKVKFDGNMNRVVWSSPQYDTWDERNMPGWEQILEDN